MNYKVILFDGVCNLCNYSVQTIIKYDKKRVFRFASLQSEFSDALLKKYNRSKKDFDSVILIDGNNIYEKASAFFEIIKYLRFPLILLYPFRILPNALLNKVYDLIAKKRYKWFGKRKECMIPTPELKSLFLD
ncbi:MAG: DCC1-like thiol-disulfide oxidoreductase family protein [Melioribacteraceae bacterium]|nr:DCC1-like thiol-disulfide oxidoreductase family protein [Melioribacteraceae bacterium]